MFSNGSGMDLFQDSAALLEEKHAYIFFPMALAAGLNVKISKSL